MSFLHAPSPDAGAVTTIPPPSLSGRALAMISHIHLATRVEDLKRDEKKVTFVCGPNQKSLEMTEDLFHGLVATYVAMQKDAREKVESLQQQIREQCRRSGVSEEDVPSGGTMFEQDNSDILTDALARLLPKSRSKGKKNEQEGEELEAVTQLQRQYEFYHALSDEFITIKLEMHEADNMGTGPEAIFWVTSVYIYGDEEAAWQSDWDTVLQWRLFPETRRGLFPAPEEGDRVNKRRKTSAPAKEADDPGIGEYGMRKLHELGKMTGGAGPWGWVTFLMQNYLCRLDPEWEEMHCSRAVYRELAKLSSESKKILFRDGDLQQARCRQTDGPWSPDWIGTDLERFRVGCVFSMEVAKRMGAGCNSQMIQWRWATQLQAENYARDSHSYCEMQEQGANVFAEGVDYRKPFDHDADYLQTVVFTLSHPTHITADSHLNGVSFFYWWQRLADVDMALYNSFAEQSRSARVPDKLDLSNHIFKEFSSSYAHILAQYGAMLRETRLKPELAEKHTPLREIQRRNAQNLFSAISYSHDICHEAASLFAYITDDAQGFSGRRPQRPYVYIPVSPDAPGIVVAQQRQMTFFEILEVSVYHSICRLCWQIHLGSMNVEDGLYLNLILSGPGEHGKSFLMDLVKKKLAVPNTVEEVQERTACAHRTMQPPIFHLTELTPEVGGEAWGQGGPNGKRSTGSGDNDKINVLKSEITENSTSYKTLLPIQDSGKREQVSVRLARHGGKILATNINDIVHAFSSPFLTRFITFQVAQICRKDGEISDKMAFSSLSVTDESSQKLKKEIIPLCFRHEQAFHATVCMLVNSSILLQPDTSCIAVLLNYVKRSLQKKSIGYHVSPRTNEQCKRMAVINCYTDLFDRHFCHRYSKYHADRIVALEDFVSLEPELVVTTAHAMAAIQQIVAPKLHRQEANAIARAVVDYVKKNGNYVAMFVDPTKRVGSDDQEAVDRGLALNYLVFDMTVSEFAEKVVASHMGGGKNNMLCPEQIKGVLHMLETSSEGGASAWSEIADMPINMNQVHPDLTVSSMASKLIAFRDADKPHKITKIELNECKAEWSENGNSVAPQEYGSGFFPYIDKEHGITHHNAPGGTIPTFQTGKTSRAGSPFVQIATAFVLAAIGEGTTMDERVISCEGLSHVTPGTQGWVPGSALAIDSVFPYLVHTEEIDHVGKDVCRIPNQDYTTANMAQLVHMGAPSDHQGQDTVEISPGMPLDTWCAFRRAEHLIKKDPMQRPCAQTLFAADWSSGARQRLAPYLLFCCLDEDEETMRCPNFIYQRLGLASPYGPDKYDLETNRDPSDPCPNRAERQGLAVRIVETVCRDFVEPTQPKASPDSMPPMVHLACDCPGRHLHESFCDECALAQKRCTNELADLVVNLSMTPRAGALRLSMCNKPPEKIDIDRVMQGPNAHTERLREPGTFIDDWHSYFGTEEERLESQHYGPGYMRLIRSEAWRLWQQHDAQDGQWLAQYRCFADMKRSN